MDTAKPLAIVAGAGAGLGQSLMARFEAEGMAAVGLGRTEPDQSAGRFLQLDLSDERASRATITGLIAEYGPPETVVHNTAELVIAPFTESALDDDQRVWASMVQSLVILGQSAQIHLDA